MIGQILLGSNLYERLGSEMLLKHYHSVSEDFL